jgi:hypothetical protein
MASKRKIPAEKDSGLNDHEDDRSEASDSSEGQRKKSRKTKKSSKKDLELEGREPADPSAAMLVATGAAAPAQVRVSSAAAATLHALDEITAKAFETLVKQLRDLNEQDGLVGRSRKGFFENSVRMWVLSKWSAEVDEAGNSFLESVEDESWLDWEFEIFIERIRRLYEDVDNLGTSHNVPEEQRVTNFANDLDISKVKSFINRQEINQMWMEVTGFVTDKLKPAAGKEATLGRLLLDNVMRRIAPKGTKQGEPCGPWAHQLKQHLALLPAEETKHWTWVKWLTAINKWLAVHVRNYAIMEPDFNHQLKLATKQKSGGKDAVGDSDRHEGVSAGGGQRKVGGGSSAAGNGGGGGGRQWPSPSCTGCGRSDDDRHTHERCRFRNHPDFNKDAGTPWASSVKGKEWAQRTDPHTSKRVSVLPVRDTLSGERYDAPPRPVTMDAK